MLREFLTPWDVHVFGLRRKAIGVGNGPGVNALWLFVGPKYKIQPLATKHSALAPQPQKVL